MTLKKVSWRCKKAMIERQILKDRIMEFSKALRLGEFKTVRRHDWKKSLLEGKIPFQSHGTEYKVDFRNIDFTGPEVENQEWRAQLNRFLWLDACMVEDLKSESDYFARVAADSILAFHDFRRGIHIPDKEFLWKELGDNTLSISIRLGMGYGRGWWGTVPFMRESVIDDAFLEMLYKSTKEQADFMIKHMTSCGNWRMNQLYCLLFLGYIFMDNTWLEIGARGLNEAFHSQVGKDGSHEEHTTSYHNWMTSEFTALFCLSREIPDIGLKIDVDGLIGMWEYTILSMSPDKRPTGLNDETRWGYVNMDTYPEIHDRAVGVRSMLLKEFKNVKADDISKESRYFKDAGQWFMRHYDIEEASMLIFDATRFGGGHCHKAHNSISYYFGNKMLLLDPGTFNYERKDPFCIYGRQSLSHNTVSIDGLPQVTCASNEAISDIKGKCSFVFNAYSAGYADEKNGVQGVHERLVLWYKNRICIINDSVVGSGSGYTANFNLLPCDYYFEEGALYTGHKDYNVMLKPLYSNKDFKTDVYEASMEPMAGWLAKDGYKLNGAEPGLSMQVSGKIEGERGTVTAYALIPFKGSDRPDACLTNADDIKAEEDEDIRSRIYNSAGLFSIKSSAGSFELVSAYLKYRHSRLHPSIGRSGNFESDGKLAFVELSGDKVVFAYLYDGTYLRYKGQTLVEEKEYGNYEETF
ncbi:MAG TPA: heparinase II/III family protein [Clostridia bacterium]|nr:heparinase II/III family protein [Clostridia bacterium]